MPDSSALPLRWNIFARELESILADHGWELGYLDDRKVVYNREKVRRLQKSLRSPGHLATLNPEEMQRLIAILDLDEQEQKRLQASLLATAVERTLLDRVDKETAFTASQDVFKILLAAMEADPRALPGIKGGRQLSQQSHEVMDDALPERIMRLLDRALLAIHSAQKAPDPQARQINAQEAMHSVARVVTLLRDNWEDSEDWQNWQREAMLIQQLAEAVLRAARS
ncbi:MAG TPA: hypothetical protein VGD98_03485 [Ktedonobacteraceae bacterium]